VATILPSLGGGALAFNAPVGGVPVGIPEKKFGRQKTRIMELPGSEDSLTID